MRAPRLWCTLVVWHGADLTGAVIGMRWLAVSVCVAAAAFAAWARVHEWGWFLVAGVVIAVLTMVSDIVES